MNYDERLATFTARAEAGDWPTSDEMDALRRLGHAEKYPAGCGAVGHRCEECQRRLDEPPHAGRSYKVGARPGYRGEWRHECTVRGCPYR